MVYSPYYRHPMWAKIRTTDRNSQDSILMLRSTSVHAIAHDLKLCFRGSQKSYVRINMLLEWRQWTTSFDFRHWRWGIGFFREDNSCYMIPLLQRPQSREIVGNSDLMSFFLSGIGQRTQTYYISCSKSATQIYPAWRNLSFSAWSTALKVKHEV